jgi:hypothetical protein
MSALMMRAVLHVFEEVLVMRSNNLGTGIALIC